MEYTTLGRTGLRVSKMGLGCGGHSRLGTRAGNTEVEAEKVVREALSLGVNFFDTAESYGTEEIVGRALLGTVRESVVISTKAGVEWDGRRSTPADYRTRLEACLKRLRSEYVDVFHLHGVVADEYAYAVETLVPCMHDLKAEGKVRFIGITEAFGSDPAHGMLASAQSDDCWDVIMVGFNLFNQSARERVFPWTTERNIGTLGMFAIRRALTSPELARKVIQDLVADGKLDADAFDTDDPLGFLVGDDLASTLSEAAYRFCRWEFGIDVVLSGTGSVNHLRANAEALARPPLPEVVTKRLRAMFAGVDSVAGN